jgi:hypothetical protein
VKRTFILETSDDLRRFESEFRKLADCVRSADGKYVLHIDTRSAPSRSIFVDKATFDRAVSPAMHRKPSAFSQTVAGGRFLPDKLDAAYGALAKEAMKNEVLQRGQRKLLNREEYIAYYYGDVFSFYPSLGAPLNRSTQQKLR